MANITTDQFLALLLGQAAAKRTPRKSDGRSEALPEMALRRSEITPATNRYGALVPGNLDLTRRPYVKNADGSVSTVRSMSFREGDKSGSPYAGNEILIPTVSDDGRIMSGDEAIAEYDRTGKHMGVYSTVPAANEAGEQIHQDQMKTPPVPWRDGLPENPYEEPDPWSRY